jgi:hypothetical protein
MITKQMQVIQHIRLDTLLDMAALWAALFQQTSYQNFDPKVDTL